MCNCRIWYFVEIWQDVTLLVLIIIIRITTTSGAMSIIGFTCSADRTCTFEFFLCVYLRLLPSTILLVYVTFHPQYYWYTWHFIHNIIGIRDISSTILLVYVTFHPQYYWYTWHFSISIWTIRLTPIMNMQEIFLFIPWFLLELLWKAVNQIRAGSLSWAAF